MNLELDFYFIALVYISYSFAARMMMMIDVAIHIAPDTTATVCEPLNLFPHEEVEIIVFFSILKDWI